MWIDRRVDPQQLVNAQFTEATLSEVFDGILTPANLGWSAWGDLIYVGPQATASEIATLRAIARKSVDKLSANRRRPWLATEATSWPRLTDPRDLLAEWLANSGLLVKNPAALGHDLWDAKTFPPLSLLDRVVLLLAGYDMTCQIGAGGETLEIIPIARPVLITEQYQPGRKMRELMSAFQDNSAVTLNRQNSSVALTGRWEDHQLARSIIADAKSRSQQATDQPTSKQERRFSLKLENQPVGKVVDQLASQLGLTVEWNAGAIDQREKLTTCEIQDGTIDGLFTMVLAPVGLRYSLSDGQLLIVPND